MNKKFVLLFMLPITFILLLYLLIQYVLYPLLKNDSIDSFVYIRLPKSVEPFHYNLDITPIIDPNDSKFLQVPGCVIIYINIVETTDYIQLNSYEITIQNTTVKNLKSEAIVDTGEVIYQTNSHTIYIPLLNELLPGEKYKLTIYFESRVATDRNVDGIYLTNYTDSTNNKTHFQAFTQFQVIGARFAFPCFDEPALRATFAIRIGRLENGFHSLSNMERETTISHELSGYVWDVYPSTVVNMPTYIIAFVISNYESITARDGLYRKPVRVWGPTPSMNSSDGGNYSVEIVARMLNFYEKLMDFEYEFPKMDSVSVPDSHFVAMENWGLNLCQKSYLLHEAGETTIENLWRTSSCIGHELAHQWFGNLVTFRWWNDIWLSEGFANYLQFHAANAVTPEFEPLERVGLDASMRGLQSDGYTETVPVHTENEVLVSMGPVNIAYLKSGNLIRMMEGFLGQDILMEGLRNYLKEMKYSSATQYDLFRSLNKVAEGANRLPPGLSMDDILNTWTLQPGFPLIRIVKAAQNKIYISQERFRNNPNKTISESNTWYVPIPYTTQRNPEVTTEALLPKAWIHKDVLRMEHDVKSSDDWLLVNPDAKGHYRVLYDDHYGKLIQKQLMNNHTVFSSLSRGQLLDDYITSAFGEYILIGDALEMTRYLDKEDSFPVWSSAFINLSEILRKLDDSDLRSRLNEYLLGKVGPALERIGILPKNDEKPVKMLLRSQLLDWACKLKYKNCYIKGVELVNEWMSSDRNPIPPDLQSMFYCAAVSQGGRIYWEFMMEKYSNAKAHPRQKSLLLNALACVKDENLNFTFQEILLGNSTVTNQDAITLLKQLAIRNDAKEFVFKSLTNRVDEILVSRIGGSGIGETMLTLSYYFGTAERLYEVENFLKSNGDKLQSHDIQCLKDAIERIESNIHWMKIHKDSIQKFLQNKTF